MSMTVADVMTRDVATVQATATLKEAAKKMRDARIGALPVFAGKVLVGMITDRDITIHATALGVGPSEGKVEAAMTWKMEWCHEDADIRTVAALMEKKAIRRLAVLNRAGALVGIVSLADIAAKAHDKTAVEHVVEANSGHPARKGDGIWA